MPRPPRYPGPPPFGPPGPHQEPPAERPSAGRDVAPPGEGPSGGSAEEASPATLPDPVGPSADARAAWWPWAVAAGALAVLAIGIWMALTLLGR